MPRPKQSVSRRCTLLAAILFLMLAPSCTSPLERPDMTGVLAELKLKSKEWYKEANPFFDAGVAEGAFDRWDSIVKKEGKRLAALKALDIPLIVSEVTAWDMQQDFGPPELYTYYYRILMEALFQRKDESVSLLADALEKGKASVEVAFLLGKMEEIEQVRPVFEKSRGRTKLLAGIALARAGDAGVVGFLLDHCDLPDGGVVSPSELCVNRDLREAYTVTYTLSMMGEKILDPLYSELVNPESRRHAAARAVLNDMDFTNRKAANRIIARLLRHPDEEVRLRGADAIRFYDSELARLCVEIIREDKSDKVVDALMSTDGWGLRILVAALETKDFDRRKRIADFLEPELEKIRVRLRPSRTVLANERMNALLKSLKLPKGRALLDQIRKEPDKFLDFLNTKKLEYEIYGQLIAQDGDKVFDSLVDWILNPVKTEFPSDWAQVPAAAEALKELGPAKALERLSKLLTAEDIEKSGRILSAIARIGTPECVKFLLGTATGHADPRLRANAAALLPAESLEEITAAYEDEKDISVRRAIARRVAGRSKPSAAPFLRAALPAFLTGTAEEDADTARDIVRGLAVLGLKEDAPLFLQLLENGKTKEIREAAARGLGIVASEEHVEPLRKAIESDKEANVRKEAVMALGRIKSEKATSVLKGVLADKGLRSDAAYALAMQGCRDVIPVLFDELLHPAVDSAWHRQTAAMALTHLPEIYVKKEFAIRTAECAIHEPFAMEWLSMWLGCTDNSERMLENLSQPFSPMFYAAAVLGRSTEFYSTGNLHAIEAVIYSSWIDPRVLGGRGLELISRLFPEAPQVDYYRYRYYADCPQVDEFIEWYDRNRFNLQFDCETRLYKVMD